MKRMIWTVLIGLAIVGGSTAWGRGGEGGVPSPFGENSNRKVELADGEMYTLEGKVVFDANDIPWFWVNLSKHAWLANQKRIQSPFYRLEGSREQWKSYDEKTIRLICIAHVCANNGNYEITLSRVTAAKTKESEAQGN